MPAKKKTAAGASSGSSLLRATRSKSRSSRRKYASSAADDVKREMREFKRGRLKSGRSGKTVKSRKQAIAIGLSEARRKGKRVPAPSRRQSK